ncbi:Jacalin-related lectin 19, partial [Cucurbita argyrosperma subsp. sororia]
MSITFLTQNHQDSHGKGCAHLRTSAPDLTFVFILSPPIFHQFFVYVQWKKKEEIAMDFDLLNNPHPHPLFFIEEGKNDEVVFCTRCRRILHPPAFSCSDSVCNFHIHQSCIDLPPEIHNHFHPQHPLSRSTNNHICNACWHMPSGDVYLCRSCGFQIDVKCAIADTKASGVRQTSDNEFRHFRHPHTLTLQREQNIKTNEIVCVVCGLLIKSGSSYYFCSICDAHFHQQCAELPREMLNSDFHEHPLFLLADVTHTQTICNSCKNDCGEFIYNCSPCEFNLHVACLQSFNHKHTFTKFRNQIQFVCRACGEKGNGFSWYCTICHLSVHKECAELPLTLRTFGHRLHDLSLTYFRDGIDFVGNKMDCKFCGEEIKTKYAAYGCYKCKYFVHLDCARKQPNFTVDDLDSSDDENAKIEVSGSEIQHFIHHHRLAFVTEEQLRQDRVCDGCMKRLSGPSYGCEECGFFAHKECLELPRKKRNFLHQHRLNLISIPDFVFQCKACLKHFNGFAYHCKTCLSTFDTRCASIKIPFEHPGHQHPLSLDRSNDDHICEGCKEGVKNKMAFRCVDCNFHLDAGCATLPLGVRYRFDPHPLDLTFVEDEEEEYCCDICEEEREPGPWFYSCQKCSFAAHLDCAVGMFPFVKLKKHEAHKHTLKLGMKGKEEDCVACGESCAEELAYECISNCKFKVHAIGLCYHRQVVQGSLAFTNRSFSSRGIGLHQHTIQNGRIHRTIGPYGGGGGSAWNEKVFTKIRAFGINHQELIYSIQIQYEKDGKLTWSTMHGSDGGSRSEVVFDQDEHLVSIHGYYSDLSKWRIALVVIRSLTLETNKKSHGPFGVEDGTKFSFPTGIKLVGLHGRSGSFLDAIGPYAIAKE